MFTGGVPLVILVLCTVARVTAMFTCEGPNNWADDWPSENELQNFSETIEGTIALPGSQEWENATYMINTVFNSWFGAVVYPRTTADVQAAILFAKENKIRPTISSSTHSFVGRSAGDYTFHISLKEMKQLDINTDDSTSPTGYSMTIGTGNSWLDIYKEVDKYNLIAVGGSAHTVSPGGWTLGGGHSPITRMLGLGVDQVLQFTMVTADGSIVTVTENSGTVTSTNGSTEALDDGGDLWWSVLGGGGGVYGVVTQFKLKLHEPPAEGFLRLTVTFLIHTTYEECRGVATEALQKFFDRLSGDLPTNWGGYVMTMGVQPDDPSEGQYGGTLLFFINRWGGTLEEAKQEMAFLTDFRPECQYGEASWKEYATFLEYELTAQDELYYRHYMVGRLIQPDDMTDQSLAKLLTSVDDVNVDIITCLCIMIGGESEVNLEEKSEATSASPHLRTARCALGCATGWDNEDKDAHMVSEMEALGDRLDKFGNGVYYNEPAYFQDDWKTEFWGSMDRYNRLLRTKQQWDPDNMFWCHHCVGSDLVTHQSEDYCSSPYNLYNATYSSAQQTAPAALVLVIAALLSLWLR